MFRSFRRSAFYWVSLFYSFFANHSQVSFSYLHRDVKPGNYTIGRADMNELRRIYVLDFGMARKFVHDDGTMKKPRSAAGFRGTVRYAALSCHMQREMCRKDDVGKFLLEM